MATQLCQSPFVGTVNKSFKKYDYVNGIHRGITSAALKWKIKIDESKTFRDFQYEGKASTRLVIDASNNQLKWTTRPT